MSVIVVAIRVGDDETNYNEFISGPPHLSIRNNGVQHDYINCLTLDGEEITIGPYDSFISIHDYINPIIREADEWSQRYIQGPIMNETIVIGIYDSNDNILTQIKDDSVTIRVHTILYHLSTRGIHRYTGLYMKSRNTIID